MQRRSSRSLIYAGCALTLVISLGACTPGGQFDPTEIVSSDAFSTKKKISGEREPLFPQGVPGAETGVPPDLMKGYQPPPEPPAATADATPKAETAATKPKPKAKPKPKPKIARAPAPASGSRIRSEAGLRGSADAAAGATVVAEYACTNRLDQLAGATANRSGSEGSPRRHRADELARSATAASADQLARSLRLGPIALTCR